MYKALFVLTVLCTLLSGCDLQPRISSIPDSIGAFISDRYPALLADPETQPEIYNSAVTDYEVYASPELYGAWKNDDYVLYASVDDYVLVPTNEDDTAKAEVTQTPIHQPEDDYLVVPMYAGATDNVGTTDKDSATNEFVVVVKGDTLYSIAKKNNTSVEDLAKLNKLSQPYTLSIGQKLQVRESKPEPNVISQEKLQQIKTEKAQDVATTATDVKRVGLQEITVAKGDTLYSLSRKYQIPVNDLAVMNKLNTPFNLSVGQKLKVPKLDTVQTRSVAEIKESKTVAKKITPPETVQKQTTVSKAEPVKTRISSDPKKQLPKISARSSTKFSWPVKGKVLSQYGAKNKGLFNDGINISAAKGTPVKSAENGVVAYAGNEVKGMGNLIIIQHSDGWMTVYAHMDSLIVKRGAKVNVGQQIGRVGQTGRVDTPQLHFEIRKGTKAYNPQDMLKK